MESFETRFPISPYDPNADVDVAPWMVEGLWMLGRINGVFGPEKSGKSRLMGWLLAGLLAGKDESDVMVRLARRPKRWLYLAGEEPKEVVMQRLHRYAELHGLDMATAPIDFIEASGMRLDLPHQRASLERILQRDGYDGLVVEPLRRVHDADENDNSELAPFHNDLRRWSNVHGTTILLCHHTGKLHDDADTDRIATWSRGATDLAAIVDTACFLQETWKETGGMKRGIRLLRAGRYPPLPPLLISDLGGRSPLPRDDLGFSHYNEGTKGNG